MNAYTWSIRHYQSTKALLPQYMYRTTYRTWRSKHAPLRLGDLATACGATRIERHRAAKGVDRLVIVEPPEEAAVVEGGVAALGVPPAAVIVWREVQCTCESTLSADADEAICLSACW